MRPTPEDYRTHGRQKIEAAMRAMDMLSSIRSRRELTREYLEDGKKAEARKSYDQFFWLTHRLRTFMRHPSGLAAVRLARELEARRG